MMLDACVCVARTPNHQAWALMEAKEGNTDAAISLFKEAILKRPRDGAVWQAYALLLKVSKRAYPTQTLVAWAVAVPLSEWRFGGSFFLAVLIERPC